VLPSPDREFRDAISCSADIERRGSIKVNYGHPVQDSPQILEKEIGPGITAASGD